MFFNWIKNNKIKSVLISLGLAGVVASPPVTEVVKRVVSVDWDFIKALEGFKLKGYVPNETNEKTNRVLSGVTIASGFDLGQHDINDLESFGLEKPLVQKLEPYVGLKGKAAKAKLKEQPLVLSVDQADHINKQVKQAKIRELIQVFDKESVSPFLALSPAQQTVIMSVAFQYGDLKKRTPNFWRLITKGKWNQAVDHLKNFGDAYKTRRLKEAALLAESLAPKQQNV